MGTGFWIILAVLAVLLFSISGRTKQGSGKSSVKAGDSTRRIDHLHYTDLDEYECTKCGARFRKDLMVCPKCGARFTGTTENMEAYDEELEEELEMDEWDEE